MSLDNAQTRAYLFELYTMTGGDTDAQVSMYDVGAVLGLEKAEAGTMAEDLFIQGFAELKTLSGGIGITFQGLEVLDVTLPAQTTVTGPGLGSQAILGEPGRKTVDTLLAGIRADIGKHSFPYAQLEEMMMDIKTIEAQMLSPKPKTSVVREVFQSLHDNLNGSGNHKGLAANLNTLITS
jgi:hypothetical protein